ncbi:hypothetical protein GGQ97_002647 [Sphingomonas kaistensis]|uniref:Uncharacterized protein n=1 Tax=Sphingomonas kaistensis TaxID=298708 RepID=A0A7X5Y804_9SPHN|nr:hypothetical protein [Sphingomonas kaistensis]NJC06854.1 hypothetical protein [Sphingomonas kaistensis]
MARKNKVEPTEERDAPAKHLARVVADSIFANSAVMSTYGKPTFGGEVDLGELYETLSRRALKVREGDLSSAENMLVAQAATLNLLFLDLTRRSSNNMGEYIDAAERYMRLALKAQAQCRATLEALAEIKKPPTVFTRQANIAAGHQQINNAAGTCACTRAEITEGSPNELLEANNGASEWLERGAPSEAIACDQDVGSLVPINRSTDNRR